MSASDETNRRDAPPGGALSQLGVLTRGMRLQQAPILSIVLAALVGAGLYAFLAIADEVSENEIEQIDNYLFMLFRSPQDPSTPLGPEWLREAMIEITSLGGYPLLVIIVALVIGFLMISRLFGPALFVFLSIVSGTAVGQLLKVLYDRPRPDLVEHLVTTHTASFPSGHATMSAVVYLTLAALIVQFVERTNVRVYVMTMAVLLTLAIGISRIYLGVHWPSDVAAGWALGVAWASLSVLVVRLLELWRSRRGPSREH